ncbi:MAG: hypothetical protein N4A59_06975 [Marinifilum sp.]|nr:hypothetical protein [Marinifilum sp.]MCT4644641.1 hypothetical protein [Carboxylicivirga sp.]
MKINYGIILILWVMALCSCQPSGERGKILTYAMSHNDYEHDNPLWDAYSKGFICVEADVFLEDEELYVAHTHEEINRKVTLKSLYLNPIKALVSKGEITEEKPLWLYINLKTSGRILEVINKQLDRYREMLVRFDLDGYHPAPVKVIAGSWSAMEQWESRYVFAEGGVNQLISKLPSSSVFLINEQWTKHFSWQGKGEMPVDEELILRQWAREAEKKGSILRFWDTDVNDQGARLALWKKMYDCGVDLISSDYLGELANAELQAEVTEQKTVLPIDLIRNKKGVQLLVNDEVRLANGVQVGSENVQIESKNDVSLFYLAHSGEKDTVRFVFDEIVNLNQGLAHYLFGDWESWTKPIVYTDTKQLPSQELMFNIWQHKDGIYGAMMPLCGDSWVSHLAGGKQGIGTISIDWSQSSSEKTPFLAVAFDNDPYALVERLYAEGMKTMNRKNNLRKYKSFPSMFEGLGWCTWNAMYEQVSEQKIVDAMSTFKQKSIRIPWMLIDDGWLCTDKQSRLTSQGFDQNKFPKGITPVVEHLKEEFDIDDIGVWHTMSGYWSGVDKTQFDEEMKANLVPFRDKADVHDEAWSDVEYYAPNPNGSNANRFYDSWYKYLSNNGLSFVKVDQQAIIKRLAHGMQNWQAMGYWNVATGMERALQQNVQKYFEGRIVNCQDMAVEALYNMSGSAIVRNSDDFFPERTAFYSLEVEKGNAATHTIMNLFNAVWTSQIAWPDYDMFQSHHVSAYYHAALRAISGGPVYITDTPGMQNEDVIKTLIDSRGKLYRADKSGLPTKDCLFTINKNKPLKAYSRIGEAGVLAIFNADDSDFVEGNWKVNDVDGLKGNDFVAYEYKSKTLKIVSAEDRVPINLDRLDFQYWNVIPLDKKAVVIGLLNKLNARAAVESEVIKDGKLVALLHEGGHIGMVIPQKPKNILIDGKVCKDNWHWNDQLLEINYPSMQEVKVEVEY